MSATDSVLLNSLPLPSVLLVDPLAGTPFWSRSLGGLLLQHPGPSPNQTVHHFKVSRAAFKMKHSAVVSSAATRGTCILG